MALHRGIGETHYDYIVKVVLTGPINVGKTSIITQYKEGEFFDRYMQTIGVDFQTKTITLNNKIVKIQAWDTAGQERFQTMTNGYYRGARAILLVYDITNQESFDRLEEYWFDHIDVAIKDKQVPCYLVGNKDDLEHSRAIDKVTAMTLAGKHGYTFYETSAKNKHNIDKVFTDIATQVMNLSSINCKDQENKYSNHSSSNVLIMETNKNEGIKPPPQNDGGCAC